MFDVIVVGEGVRERQPRCFWREKVSGSSSSIRRASRPICRTATSFSGRGQGCLRAGSSERRRLLGLPAGDQGDDGLETSR
jgi:hypothetical protein